MKEKEYLSIKQKEQRKSYLESKMTKYEIIDNFLPEEEFTELQAIFAPEGKRPNKNFDLTEEEKAKVAKMGFDGNMDGVQQYMIEKMKIVSVPWKYNSTVAGHEWDDPEDWRSFHMSYIVYDLEHKIESRLYEYFKPILDKIEGEKLIRIKCNLFPNTEKVHEHAWHTDLKKSHKTALLSINTCDGYTTLEYGTKIDSVANRLLKFDGGLMHKSSTTSNQTVRINVNVTYE